MAVQYTCETEARRAELRGEALNGIDYLEVRDLPSMPTADRQRFLRITFVNPLTPGSLTRDHVRIDGGVRVRNIRVTGLSDGPGPRDLTVEVDRRGDYSPYTLRLVRDANHEEPPAGFDPILSAVRFSFKAGCPSEFDCRTEETCPPEEGTAPPIDYLSKDYASFRQLMLDRISVLMPDWKERNPADLGVALVELLAHAGDQLSYQQDAVATEAYLGSARRRVSVRRHARLLDYRMHEGCNARAWIALRVGSAGDGQVLKDTRFLTRSAESVTVDPADLISVLSKHAPHLFEPMHDLALYESHNLLSFYTWGDEDCCLPRGATRATLKDDSTKRLRLRSGDVLIFEERIGSESGIEADADPARRQAVRLTRVHPEATPAIDGSGRREPGGLVTDPLNGQPIVEIEWEAEDALSFPLCLSTKVAGRTIEDVSVGVGNLVLADHGRTLQGALLNLARPRLGEIDVTHAAPYGGTGPAADALRQKPSEAIAVVSLIGGGDVWTSKRDLLNSDRFAPEFVVEVEEDRSAMLRFGDGKAGRRPTGTLTPVYRVGNGSNGNVGADTIAHVVTTLGGIEAVRNPLPASGGINPERLEEVRQYAPQAFRVQQRAVTAEDYAEVCGRHPEVQKAVATFRWTGSWTTVFITVDRKGGLPVDASFKTEIRDFVERFRMAGYDLEIDAPRFVPLEIAMTVCVRSGYFRSEVKQALLEVFSNRGFFHPDHITFGQPVYLSRVIAAAMAVPGVRWIDLDRTPPKTNRFRRWGETPRCELEEGRIPIDRLEIACLDNDPNAPENGRIEFFMEGGL